MTQSNKVAIVTGSSRSIGKAIAIESTTAGYNIDINSQNRVELSIGEKEIWKDANFDCKIIEFPGDISQEQVCIGIVNAP